MVKHNVRCLEKLERELGSKRYVYIAVDMAMNVDLSGMVLQRVMTKALLAPRILEL